MAKYDLRSEFIATNAEGIQKIPQEWQIKQVRYLLKDGAEGIKIGPFGSALKLEDMVEEGFSVYGQENVIKKDFTLGKRKISETKFHEMSVYRIFPKDILITMMGTSGKCEIVPKDVKDGIIDSHLLRVRVKENHIIPEFFKLLIDESPEIAYQIQVFGKGSIMHGLNSGIVKSLNLPLPSVAEQKHILSFLDHETAKIDHLIEKQQQLIELLKEKRQAVISHAVTKGLDPNVPMKDSGVAWLGEVPEHWGVTRLARISGIKRGSGYQNIEMEVEGRDTIQMLRIADMHEIAPALIVKNTEVIRYLVEEGDILVAGTGATAGISMLVPKECNGWVHSYNSIKVKVDSKKVNSAFLQLFLISDYIKKSLDVSFVGSAQPFVDTNGLGRLRVLLPPLHEQINIYDYLNIQTRKIDFLISKAQSAIQLMQERRTALISAAVTGKIDVRHWQAPTLAEANTELSP